MSADIIHRHTLTFGIHRTGAHTLGDECFASVLGGLTMGVRSVVASLSISIRVTILSRDWPSSGKLGTLVYAPQAGYGRTIWVCAFGVGEVADSVLPEGASP